MRRAVVVILVIAGAIWSTYHFGQVVSHLVREPALRDLQASVGVAAWWAGLILVATSLGLSIHAIRERPRWSVCLSTSALYLGAALVGGYLLFRESYESGQLPSIAVMIFVSGKTPALLMTLWIAGVVAAGSPPRDVRPSRATLALLTVSLVFWALDVYLTARVQRHPVPGWLGMQAFLVAHLSVGAVLALFTSRIGRVRGDTASVFE